MGKRVDPHRLTSRAEPPLVTLVNANLKSEGDEHVVAEVGGKLTLSTVFGGKIGRADDWRSALVRRKLTAAEVFATSVEASVVLESVV